MSMPMFWRIILGYLVILLLSVGVASYSIVQLGGLSGTARAALDTDNRMIAYEETLTDAFLSEVRYAGRFIITQNEAIHDQFRQFREDFKRYMRELTTLAVSADIKARLLRVDESHLRYHDLFDQEVRYIKTGQPYAHSRYQEEREKILDSALRELEGLKAQLNKNLQDKLETMERAARAARTISIAGTLVLVGLGIALSLIISRSITKPLAELRRRTAEEPEPDGDFASAFSRIPEIRELSDTLTQERWRLRETARSQANFVDSVATQLAAPLTSLKQRVDYLSKQLAQTIAQEQNASFEIIIKETERLIEHCARVKPIPTARLEAEEIGRQSARQVLGKMPQSGGARIGSAKVVLHPADPASKNVAERGRNLLAMPWLAVSQSIQTLRYRMAKKQ
jgi:CHASE3 domain sensor protein